MLFTGTTGTGIGRHRDQNDTFCHPLSLSHFAVNYPVISADGVETSADHKNRLHLFF